jgi:hypothetical protein
MRGEDDDAELEVRMLLELAERPVEVAVVGARGGDDGDGLHAYRSLRVGIAAL